MRSSVSVKGMFLSLLIVFIGASLLCYLFLYRPKVFKAIKGAREMSSLTRRFDSALLETKRIREEIERINKERVNVDYFTRHQIPPEQRQPTFLAKVSDVVNRLGIKTIMVKPMPQEESPEYIRYPFVVETKSKYEDIIKFIDSLENSFGLNLDDLHIENDPKDPLWHRLKFTVSTFEFQRAESPPSDEKGTGEGSTIQPEVRDDIVVKRDPFLEKEPKKKRPVITASIPKIRRKRLPPLKLNAIIDIAGRKIAIINDTIVREGDWVAKHRIVEIDEDKVILEYRGKERVLKIEDLVKTKKG
ncbi:MAG: type 4a pilus biogenesis protein PilO [Proteobacteria bacterium]|nr:type 4a pilus biogenesis protein PilO [Pseudomonadota bacterium]